MMVDVYGSQILMEYIYMYTFRYTVYVDTIWCTWPQADDAPEAYRLAAQALLALYALWIASPKGLTYQW